MKRILTLLLINLAITLHAQEKNASILNFIISNDLKIPQQVNLELSHFGGSQSSIYKLDVTGRRVVFKRNLSEPVLVDIEIKWSDNTMRFRLLLPVDTGMILIGADKKVTIKFKNEQGLWSDFADLQQQIVELKNQSDERIKNINFENRQMNAVQNEIDSIKNHYEDAVDTKILKETIYSHSNSFLGAYALISYAERPFGHQRRKFQTDSLLKMRQLFSEKIRSLPSMKALHARLLSEKSLGIGNIFPTFKLLDTLNQLKDLHTYLGKYTLVDFWASWCAPCRAEHPNILKEYEKYKSSGFKISSVSIDKVMDKNLWRHAISQDGIGRWHHFIDADDIAKQQLNIQFIPANFLLDSEGRIIARDLRGEDLNNKLSELFQLNKR